jgi:hypothetical protein
MADGIDPTMNRVKAIGAHTAVGSRGRHAEGTQLCDRNYSVLPGRCPGDEGVDIGFVTFIPHVGKEGAKGADFAPSLPAGLSFTAVDPIAV